MAWRAKPGNIANVGPFHDVRWGRRAIQILASARVSERTR